MRKRNATNTTFTQATGSIFLSSINDESRRIISVVYLIELRCSAVGCINRRHLALAFSYIILNRIPEVISQSHGDRERSVRL